MGSWGGSAWRLTAAAPALFFSSLSLLATTPGQAQAAYIYSSFDTSGGANLSYGDDLGQNNAVTIKPELIVSERAHVVSISDPGASVIQNNSVPECITPSATSVICQSLRGTGLAQGALALNIPPIRVAEIRLGEGSDTLGVAGGHTVLRLYVLPGPGADVVRTGTGADTIAHSPGADVFDGGFGSDTAMFWEFGEPSPGVSVTLDGVADDGLAGEGDNVLPSMENVDATNGPDLVVGSSLSNEISGHDGNDELDGGAGTDRITGGRGDDRILARDGERDIIACEGGSDTVQADTLDQVAGDCEIVNF